VAAAPAVLVTRPSGQADGLCRSLQALGLRAVHQPLLVIEALTPLGNPARRVIAALDQSQHVIFISGNAVQHGMRAITDWWPQLPTAPNWYAVGAATARALAQWSVPVVAAAGTMDSEALLALPELRDVVGHRVLLVKGEGGRDHLRATLASRGAQVDELRCYRRRCVSLAPHDFQQMLTREGIALLLLSSGESLDCLQQCLGDELKPWQRRLQIVVPGARVAAAASEAGWLRVVAADNATDEAMSAAVAAIIDDRIRSDA